MKYLIVDGSGFFWRVFSACKPRRHNGVEVAALQGFITTLLRPLVERSREERVCVVFDAPGPTFRHHLYPAYKANRPPHPAELTAQAPLVRAAVGAYGLRMIEKDCFEADDIIATLATRARAEGGEVTIVTGDKDMMQLVGEGVGIFDHKKKLMIREPEVVAAMGVRPSQIVDLQALAGDSADNVPGVRGIGMKHASRLLNEFGTLDGIYENLSSVKPDGIRTALSACRKEALISRSLVRLATDIPVQESLSDFTVGKPVEPMEFLARYGMPDWLAPRFSRRFPDWGPSRTNNGQMR